MATAWKVSEMLLGFWLRLRHVMTWVTNEREDRVSSELGEKASFDVVAVADSVHAVAAVAVVVSAVGDVAVQIGLA